MLVNIDGTNRNLPDFFVVGAPKSGTTSLFKHFENMSSFYSDVIKEPHYFAYKDLGNSFLTDAKRKPRLQKFKEIKTDLKSYLALYDNADRDRLLGDFSTHYLRYSERFIENVLLTYKEKASNIKVIAILRDPVARAYSHYSMKKRGGSETLSFLDAINPDVIEKRMQRGYFPSYNYIRFSEYTNDLKRLNDVFRHVLIVNFDELVISPSETMQRILAFLEVNESLPDVKFNRSNVSGRPKDTMMAKSIFHLLYKRSFIKSIFPAELKRKYREKVRNLFIKNILVKDQISPEECAIARQYLLTEYEKGVFNQ